MTEYSLAAEQAPDTTVTLADPGPDSGLVQRTVLPGGLRVITETRPGASAAFGVSVDSGSRDEDDAHSGISHFLEHLLFKGTRSRTGKELLDALAGVGARHLAYTDREHTSFTAHLRARDLPTVVEILGDMATSATLDADAMEVERGVILQEIEMHAGDPSSHVSEFFTAALFPGSGLGASIGGHPDNIRTLSCETVADWYRKTYVPSRLIVSASGNLDHHQVVDMVRTGFAHSLAAADGARPAPPRPTHPQTAAASGTTIEARDIDQAHLTLGMEGLSHTDELTPALMLVNAALGAGHVSRLCRRIRDEHGLAYAVYSGDETFADTGQLQIYAGCAPDKAAEVVALIRAELELVAAKGLTSRELDRVRAQVLGGLALDGESALTRMTGLTQNELHLPQFVSRAEVASKLDAVTPDEAAEVAAQVLTRPQTVVAVGPFSPDRVF